MTIFQWNNANLLRSKRDYRNTYLLWLIPPKLGQLSAGNALQLPIQQAAWELGISFNLLLKAATLFFLTNPGAPCICAWWGLDCSLRPWLLGLFGSLPWSWNEVDALALQAACWPWQLPRIIWGSSISLANFLGVEDSHYRLFLENTPTEKALTLNSPAEVEWIFQLPGNANIVLLNIGVAVLGCLLVPDHSELSHCSKGPQWVRIFLTGWGAP